jgi:glycosyltransferase involved in cell wall biosynthesis
MTAYNGAKYISEQLKSFSSQIRLPDEVVVCDDMSSDETYDILKRFSLTAPFEVIIIRNNINLGYTKNFEKAISLCTGDLIFLSDQDDIWYENKISRFIDIKILNSNFNVIISDAIYTNEMLENSGVTVLEKVLNFSGRKQDHIAGACTAITKEFRDFILPLPKLNCPAHDVYIHRWANLLQTKYVSNEVLQVWRIHGLNNSRSEMNNPQLINKFSLYNKYKNYDSSSSYLLKASEFETMNSLLLERKNSLLKFLSLSNLLIAQNNINNTIIANRTRANLSNINKFKRLNSILSMLIKGQYSYFNGFKSFLKDMLI